MSTAQSCLVSLLAPVMSSTCELEVDAPVRLLAACWCSNWKQVVGVGWSTKAADAPSVGGHGLFGIEVTLVDRYLLCALVLRLQSRSVALPRATKKLLARCKQLCASFCEGVSRSAWVVEYA